MDVAGVTAELRHVAAAVAASFPEAVWYLFGSMTTTPDLAEDVDVLILAAHPEVGETARRLLDHSHLPPVVDLLVMSPDEERQLRWVACQSAIEIFPRLAHQLLASPPPAIRGD